MNDLTRTADRVADVRRVREWRDTHLLRAPLALSDTWVELRPQVAARVAALPMAKLLVPTSVTKGDL